MFWLCLTNTLQQSLLMEIAAILNMKADYNPVLRIRSINFGVLSMNRHATITEPHQLRQGRLKVGMLSPRVLSRTRGGQ